MNTNEHTLRTPKHGGRRRCGPRDITHKLHPSSLIKCRAETHRRSRVARRARARDRGLGGRVLAKSRIPRRYEFCHTRSTGGADHRRRSAREAGGQPGRTPAPPTAPGTSAPQCADPRSEVCADRRLDNGADTFIFHTRRGAHRLQPPRAVFCSPCTVDGASHAPCPDHVLVVYLVTHHLSLPPPPDGESQRHAPW